jgi:hypothetical protein
MFCAILAEIDDPGVAAGAFADFSNHPPGPQIDHRRMMILGNMRQHGVHSLAIRCGAPAA